MVKIINSQKKEGEGILTSGILHNFSGYVNALELGLDLKTINDLENLEIIYNFGNDN